MRLANLQAELAELLLELHTSTKTADPGVIVPQANFAIYQNNFLSAIRHCMENIFPYVMQLTGSDFFRQAIHDYAKSYPSRQGYLQNYGCYFSDFLAEYLPSQHLLYLPEVAQFEWLCHYVSIAAEHPPLDIKKLSDISPEHYEQLYFVLHPACVVKQFYYPILKITELCRNERNQPQSLLDLDNEKGINLLIMRKNLDTLFTPLTVDEYQCLNALQVGKSLSTALAAATAANHEFKLEEKLPDWIQHKILIDCYISSNIADTPLL